MAGFREVEQAQAKVNSIVNILVTQNVARDVAHAHDILEPVAATLLQAYFFEASGQPTHIVEDHRNQKTLRRLAEVGVVSPHEDQGGRRTYSVAPIF